MLAANSETRLLVEDDHVFHNYKQIQFFDTLALYFNLRHASEHSEELFMHVPCAATDDRSVRAKPCKGNIYRLDPFPFCGEKLEVFCKGRYVHPFPAAQDFTPEQIGAILRALPPAVQKYTFILAENVLKT